VGFQWLDALNTAWTEYESDGDTAALASKRAFFFRVIFAPSLAEALAPSRGAQDRQAFADRMEEGVRRLQHAVFGLEFFNRRTAAHRVTLAENLLKVSVQRFVDRVIHDKSFLDGLLSMVGQRSASLQQP
jgi:hypothetical protein